jgi:hypothetical protein
MVNDRLPYSKTNHNGTVRMVPGNPSNSCHKQVINHSKVGFSLMFCCNAAGQFIPPMVLNQSGTGSVYQCWCEGGSERTTYAANKSCWFDMSMFNMRFKQAGFYNYRT